MELFSTSILQAIPDIAGLASIPILSTDELYVTYATISTSLVIFLALIPLKMCDWPMEYMWINHIVKAMMLKELTIVLLLTSMLFCMEIDMLTRCLFQCIFVLVVVIHSGFTTCLLQFLNYIPDSYDGADTDHED